MSVPQVWRSVGWRVIALSLSVYGLLYLYEKLTWTDASRERALKQQFVEHAARRLRAVVPVSSSGCSQQVHKLDPAPSMLIHGCDSQQTLTCVCVVYICVV